MPCFTAPRAVGFLLLDICFETLLFQYQGECYNTGSKAFYYASKYVMIAAP